MKASIVIGIGAALLLGLILATVGLRKSRIMRTERQAVAEATAALEHCLRELSGDPTLAKPVLNTFPIGPTNALNRLIHLDIIRAQEQKKAEEARSLHRAVDAKIRSFSGQRLLRLTGQGYTPPIWNIQGHHYLSANRTAEFDRANVPIRMFVMHPAAYACQGGAALEMTNNPAKSGFKKVGGFRFSLSGSDLSVIVSHSDVGLSIGGVPSGAVTARPAPPRPQINTNWIADLIAVGPLTNEANGHVYSLLPPGLTWLQSQRAAEELGGTLVIINDAQEQSWIESTFLGETNLWIGLVATNNDLKFSWVNGEELRFENWAAGEPNFPFEKHGLMWSKTSRQGEGGKWNNSDLYFFPAQGLVEVDPSKAPAPINSNQPMEVR